MQNLPDYLFIDKLSKLPFIKAIYIYGSRARGDHRARSDIDIAILCPEADISDWQRVLDIIEDADTLLPIDVLRLDTLPEGALKQNIWKDKKAIYRKEASYG